MDATFEIWSNVSNQSRSDVTLNHTKTIRVFNYLPFMWTMGIMGFFTVLFNGMIIVAFCVRRALRTISNGFLVSLAISDFLVGLITVPLNMAGLIYGEIYMILGTVTIVNLLITLGNLYVITWDRYLCITEPMEYDTRMTQRRAMRLIIAAWITPLPISITIQLLQAQSGVDSVGFKFIVGSFSGILILLSLLICYAYYYILKEAKYQIATIEFQLRSVRRMSKVRKVARIHSGHKATKTCAMIVGSFTLCWLPTLLFDLISLWGIWDDYVDLLTIVLAFLNSLIDPLIYSFHRTDFRSEFIIMIKTKRLWS